MEEGQKVPAREAERMMNLQDVILKAMAKTLTWIEAAEIAGRSVRHFREKLREEHDTGLSSGWARQALQGPAW